MISTCFPRILHDVQSYVETEAENGIADLSWFELIQVWRGETTVGNVAPIARLISASSLDQLWPVKPATWHRFRLGFVLSKHRHMVKYILSEFALCFVLNLLKFLLRFR